MTSDDLALVRCSDTLDCWSRRLLGLRLKRDEALWTAIDAECSTKMRATSRAVPDCKRTDAGSCNETDPHREAAIADRPAEAHRASESEPHDQDNGEKSPHSVAPPAITLLDGCRLFGW